MITLLFVWLALMLLLGLTIGISLSSLGASGSLASAMTISTAKMLLVVYFFMELRRARWALRLMAVGAAAMFGILLMGTLADVMTRRHDPPPVAPREGVSSSSIPRDGGVVVPGDDFR